MKYCKLLKEKFHKYCSFLAKGFFCIPYFVRTLKAFFYENFRFSLHWINSSLLRCNIDLCRIISNTDRHHIPATYYTNRQEKQDCPYIGRWGRMEKYISQRYQTVKFPLGVIWSSVENTAIQLDPAEILRWASRSKCNERTSTPVLGIMFMFIGKFLERSCSQRNIRHCEFSMETIHK